MKIVENIEVHDTLNNKLFDKNNKLYPEVKKRIIDIVDEFISTLSDDVDLDVLDIHLVGSNASFNYTDKSDVDIHIIVNPEDYLDGDLLMAYCNAKRGSFRDKYDIKLKGMPIEITVEDVNSGIVSNGVYSVYNDGWVKFPIDIPVKELNVSDEVKTLSEKILEELYSDSDVVYLKKMLNEIYMMRKNSLAVDGEFGKGNYIFKALRDAGLIKALKDKIVEEKSKQLTLEGACRDCLVM